MKTGLVILDMLNDFVDGTLANPAAKPIIGKIGDVADAVRNRDDWVVIYANDAHKPGDVEFEVFGEHALAGSPGAEVVPALTPEAGDIVEQEVAAHHDERSHSQDQEGRQVHRVSLF